MQIEVYCRSTVRDASDSAHVDMARAVYDASAEGYGRFAGVEISAATEGPVDRSLLAAFVELMADAPAGRVADLGCGPGRVAAFLATHGFEVIGVDVSAAMVEAARNAHPTIEFEVGQLAVLPMADASLAGAVAGTRSSTRHRSIVTTSAWSSVVYWLRAATSCWSFRPARVRAYTGLTLTARTFRSLPYRHDPDVVIRTLSDTGLKVHTRALREPQFTHESSPQAFIIARTEPRQS